MSTLTVGTIVETAAWRVHRQACGIVVTSLLNAGKRGKTCAQWCLGFSTAGAELDMVADVVVNAIKRDVSESEMADVCAGVQAEWPRVAMNMESVHALDVAAPGGVRVASETVTGLFTTAGWKLTFSGDRDIVFMGGRTTATRAMAWARENAVRLPTMRWNEAYESMKAHGIRVS